MKTYDLEAASKTIAKNVLTPPLRTAGPTFCSAIIDRWLLEPEFLQKMLLLKVSKFQKQIFFFPFEPKNEWNYFLISALRVQNRANKKIKVGIIYMLNTP